MEALRRQTLRSLLRSSECRRLQDVPAQSRSLASSASLRITRSQTPNAPKVDSTDGAAHKTARKKPAEEPTPLSDFLAPGSSPNAKPVPFSTSTSAAAALADQQPLPFLTIPLGVRNPPVDLTGPRASKQNVASESEATFTERRMQKRKIIVKEATRGYFHDFHAIRSHGGKTWRSPGTLIREDRALYFPDIIGTCLKDRSKTSTTQMLKGNVSILSILTSKISEEHTKSFYQPTLDLYASNPSFRFVQVNLQENTLKAYLVSLFLSSLRTVIPPEFHATYLISSQNLEVERGALGLHNKHVGYTYLIDSDCRIRWAGCGFAEQAEKNALIACTGVLLGRLGETPAGSGAQRRLR
ncbi:hypothetical protein K437DRAFT_277671 [Tilletiaria anomala UBC 951]|uniref:Uncharacterized protein n=1 Tax=Tilletiaria anomala (strain ATCC 24038 / CBS 436.72 / UBC 951) TaxID=1037660 RepID=A0A066WIA3_TILAU|nr:uncharacterized protein K437DRAFT_277671 [Tilletiaria anomala UBC 951]KDN52258.1 hypothetical protein K437DRAFT_277671 [Tilletiaria anomala UBC 951]